MPVNGGPMGAKATERFITHNKPTTPHLGF
jgi:hypothetical protein